MSAMRDAEYETQKARVSKLGDRWVRPLGLSTWKVEHQWHREEIPPKRGDGAYEPNRTPLFRVTCDYEYQEILIEVDLNQVKGLEDDELERHYLHEYGHYFVGELTAWVNKKGPSQGQIERVSTLIGNALFHARRWGTYDEKKRRKARKAAKVEATARALVESAS